MGLYKSRNKSGGLYGKSEDLSTSKGLEKVAMKTGLANKTRAIMSTKGEDINKIFSGGAISDVFDGLNALQYGVAGIIQGKGFVEGVKTRASFSDKDQLGKYGLLGTIGGIALDIATDPLTYIAPWTALKKIGLAPKLVKAAKWTEQTKMGKYLGDKFVYMFGKDPVYKEAFERSVRNIQIGTQNISEIAKKIVDLTPDTAKKLLTRDSTGRFKRVGLSTLKNSLNPKELEVVSDAWNKLDSLGKQAVDLGILDKKTYEENIGEYIKNAYTEYETKKGSGVFGYLKKKIAGIKPRKEGLTPEKMAELGQINNPAYLLSKSSFDLMKDVENAKFFKEIDSKMASNILKDGFKQVSTDKKFGALAGKFVPENIFNSLTEITNPISRGTGEAIMGEFKKFKTIMNPATHARNVISNQVLNWWKLGMNPLDPRTISANAEALGEIAKRGGKWIDEAKTAGYGLDTFASNEIRDLVISPEGKTAIGKAYDKIGDKLGNIYQGEENFAKLAAFIFNRKNGKGIEDAWKVAESATFNYAQVTPFVRKLRTAIWGYPFITFALKSAPTAIETMALHPQRVSVLGKIKTAIEEMSDSKETARERASEPSWIRDGFYIKLPIKDKLGRSAYFDLTYIIPFGDLVSGTLLTRNVNRETGLPESLPSSLLEKSPVGNMIKELSKNQDFYGDKIWRESDSQEQQLGDIMRYLTKTMMPPLVSDQIPGGWKNDGTRRFKGISGGVGATKENQQRTLMQEMLRNVGIKIQPIDADIQDTYMEWEKKKALETLLIERQQETDFKKFEKGYIAQ